jgi:hypothetical protein
MLKYILLLLLIPTICFAADYKQGSTWYHSDGTWTNERNGTYTHSNGGSSYQQGNTRYQSDGSWATKRGDNFTYSNGGAANKQGNTYTYSNGDTTRQQSGGYVHSNPSMKQPADKKRPIW